MPETPFDITLLPVPAPAGSVLVFRNADFGPEDVHQTIVDFYCDLAKANGAPSGIKAVTVCPLLVFLQGEATLELLDDSDMAAAGWVRAGEPPTAEEVAERRRRANEISRG